MVVTKDTPISGGVKGSFAWVYTPNGAIGETKNHKNTTAGLQPCDPPRPLWAKGR